MHPVCAAVPQERHIADLDGDVTGPGYSFRILFESATTITVTQAELPGFLELCVDVNGVPWVIGRWKAPGLLADIARAATTAGTPGPSVPPADTPPAV